MRYITPIVLALAIANVAAAQIDPPKKTVPVKAVVTPAAPKGGQALVVDASEAKGAVDWEHDFPEGAVLIEGKKLFAAVPIKSTSATYTVRLIYWDERSKEKIILSIPGTSDDPRPLPPVASGVGKKLDALTATVGDLAAKTDAIVMALTRMSARVQVLEEGRTDPPKDDPPKTDPPVEVARHLTFIVDGAEASAKIANDDFLRALLKTSGMSRNVLFDTDPKIAALNLTGPIALAGGAPCVILQSADGRVVASGRMASVQAVQALILKHRGQ